SDWGRDAYSRDDLSMVKGTPPAPGPFIFQAKFVDEANSAGAKPFSNLRSAVVAEINRINDRIQKRTFRVPSSYVLLTNAPLSSTQRKNLESLISSSLPKLRPFLWGEADLSAML